MKKLQKILSTAVALAMLTTTGASMGAMATVNTETAKTATTFSADSNNDDWIHAEGSRLYDMNGNEVWLTGANWFGLNCSENAPHYLWSADVDDMLEGIADHGINVIRFPISTELILSWMNGTPNPVSSVSANNDPYYSINVDFCNPDGTLKNSMEIFDVIIEKCKDYGLKAFIDIHSPHSDNSGHVYPLWYGKETADGTMVTTEVWIDTLVWLADKYKNDDTLLAYDLKNEPHGKGQEGSDAAKWDGSTDENNWAYASKICADAILEVNPNALILIEGVEQHCREGFTWGQGDSLTNPPYYPGWWGGNLRGVRDYPVIPETGTSQIMYSPHDYGPSVYAQTWFDKDFTTQTLLDDYWYDTWSFIVEEDIAPLLIGEWGGHMDGEKNQKWMELLRDYMINNHISHTFWCLNTNSGDTGGLWTGFQYSPATGSEITWDEEKYALFETSLWQTLETGKFIGLDHQIPLGINNTGLSLNEFYGSYASTEGSNLDGGTILSDNPKPTTTAPTTTKPIVTTTVKPADTTSNPDVSLWGDATEDGLVNVGDVIAILQSVAAPAKYPLSKQGTLNADVNLNGNGVNSNDAVSIKSWYIGLIDSLPESYN